MINTTDLFATISEITGVNVAAVNDSISFADLLGEPRALPRGYQFTERDEEGLLDQAVSDGHYKLIDFGDGRQEMYDLLDDPYEDNELLEAGTAREGQLDYLLELMSRITAEE